MEFVMYIVRSLAGIWLGIVFVKLVLWLYKNTNKQAWIEVAKIVGRIGLVLLTFESVVILITGKF